jgi:hypothetical protein
MLHCTSSAQSNFFTHLIFGSSEHSLQLQKAFVFLIFNVAWLVILAAKRPVTKDYFLMFAVSKR